ncbi:MAG: MGMT family protein [Candidatus Omnitrophica bacterium]|nr:MGMT family protein [Candidatus Omnitrophota bacterium]
MKKSDLTDFEKKVLKITSLIPLGEVRSYQWVAKKIGRPKAVRAVGAALKKNPYPIIIPCHRVIKSDGSPGGYAKGKELKKKLLLLERRIAEIIK